MILHSYGARNGKARSNTWSGKKRLALVDLIMECVYYECVMLAHDQPVNGKEKVESKKPTHVIDQSGKVVGFVELESSCLSEDGDLPFPVLLVT